MCKPIAGLNLNTEKKEREADMKKAWSMALILILVVAVVIPMAAQADTQAADPVKKDMWAGRDIKVGSVWLWNDADNIYVQYNTEECWQLTETHLDVAKTFVDIPKTRSGNPKVGHFAQPDGIRTGMEHDPAVHTYTYEVPLDGLSGWIVIAAHAVVVNCDGREETAWGGCNPFHPPDYRGGNWAHYTRYYIQ